MRVARRGRGTDDLHPTHMGEKEATLIVFRIRISSFLFCDIAAVGLLPSITSFLSPSCQYQYRSIYPSIYVCQGQELAILSIFEKIPDTKRWLAVAESELQRIQLFHQACYAEWPAWSLNWVVSMSGIIDSYEEMVTFTVVRTSDARRKKVNHREWRLLLIDLLPLYSTKAKHKKKQIEVWQKNRFYL